MHNESGATAASMLTIKKIWRMFEDTFDSYSDTCHKYRDEQQRNKLTARLHHLRMKSVESVGCVTEYFVEMMKNESCLVKLNNTNYDYCCFGDFHGSISDLVYIRHTFWRDPELLSKSHFVFLGDYVDRGIHGYEVALYLILAKIVHPQQFTVLRGNHEFFEMNQKDFLTELVVKFDPEVASDIWECINKCFAMLPYAALIDGSILCCHGGIPKNLSSIDDIDLIQKGLFDFESDSLALQLSWNDFFTKEEEKDLGPRRRPTRFFEPNWIRDTGFMIGPDAIEQFLRRHAIKYVVRAHQYNLCCDRGYNFLQVRSGAVLTIFSNSGYEFKPGVVNSTAYVNISLQEMKLSVYCLVHGGDCNHFNQSEIFEYDETIQKLKYFN